MADAQQTYLAFEHHPLYTELLQGHIIRLINIKPGEQDEPIAISLFIVELDYAPEYEALSYVWGDATNRIPILCNGRILEVTRNLEAALRRVRLPDRARLLWVDAICINQKNLRECSYHVSFMDRIYKHAKRVLVFMGPDTNAGAKDVRALIDEHEERMKAYPSLKDMPSIAAQDPILDDVRWKSFAQLTATPWFRRAWVIQEVGVADNPVVLYGNEEFDYRKWTQMSRWITRCAPGLQSKFNILLWTIHTDWEYWGPNWRETSDNPEYTLLDFLSHARGQACHRPHDHFYAFLGHPLLQTPDGGGPVITPDYAKPASEVFMDMTIVLLERFGIRLLSAVEQDERTILADFPSWALNWEVELVQNSFGYYAGFWYNASGPVAPQVPFVREGSGLKVRGQILDTILKVFQFSVTSDNLEKPEELRQVEPGKHNPGVLDEIWTSVQDGTTPCRYSIDKKLEVFSLCLVAGQISNSRRAEDDMETHTANFAAYWKLRTQAAGTQLPADLEKAGQGNTDNFWFDMSLACEGRTFIITKGGYYGLGPWIAKEGDVCCLLYGATVPYVLRRRDVSSYRLVGEGYIHGVMTGECADEQQGVDVILQ